VEEILLILALVGLNFWCAYKLARFSLPYVRRGVVRLLTPFARVLQVYYGLRHVFRAFRTWYWSTPADITLLSILEDGCNDALSEELVEVSRPGLVVEDREEATVKRRIRAGLKGNYCREITAAVKAKFGTPKPTEANLRAVRRYATEVMRENNLRHTHIQRVLPLIIAAAFVPDKYELAGMEMASCMVALDRQSEYKQLKKTAGFRDD